MGGPAWSGYTPKSNRRANHESAETLIPFAARMCGESGLAKRPTEVVDARADRVLVVR